MGSLMDRQDSQGGVPPLLCRGSPGGCGCHHVVSPVKDEVRAEDSSYNLINGTPACQSDDAMNRILKTELNFQGYVLVSTRQEEADDRATLERRTRQSNRPTPAWTRSSRARGGVSLLPIASPANTRW